MGLRAWRVKSVGRMRMILSRKNDQQRTERRLVTQGSECGGVGLTGDGDSDREHLCKVFVGTLKILEFVLREMRRH